MSEDKLSVEIVLVGAPGSGRSELAKRLINELPEKKFVLVDNYIRNISSLGIATGQPADYHVNLWAHYARFEAEQIYRDKNTNFITVGSDIETIAHQALFTEWLGEQILTPATEMATVANVTAGQLLATILQDFFFKDYAWYVPLQDGNTDYFATRLDRAIRSVLQLYRIPMPTLTGTEDDKLAEMVKVIKADQEADKENND